VFRDKEGRQVSKEAYLEEKAAAKKKAQYDSEQQLDWGGGLKQRVDASQRVAEMAAEAAKPFARSRDDRELDAMHRGRSRWGDPMVSEVVGGKGWLIAALCSSCLEKDPLCASHFLPALVLVDAWPPPLLTTSLCRRALWRPRFLTWRPLPRWLRSTLSE
jgi:hypothetical protein